MSQVHPCIKATVGAVCLLLSVSVTFFEPRPSFSVNPMGLSRFAAMERPSDGYTVTTTHESSLLRDEVAALREELDSRRSAITVMSPAE